MFRNSTKIFLGAALALGLSVSSYAFAGGKVHWDYEGEEGPEHWGELAEEFRACSEGRGQSPVNIATAEKKDLNDISFNYNPTALKILNNGHTVQVNYDAGSSIVVDGVEYSLLQFHFHTPSEHTVGGRSYDMELHLVHKSKEGNLAVVGVLLAEGDENNAYSAISGDLPLEAGEEKTSDARVNAADLIPGDRHYYTYPGSLTTPPCSEGVKWLLLKNPVQVSGEQIEAFKGVMEGNNRPVQPLWGRKVAEDSSSN